MSDQPAKLIGIAPRLLVPNIEKTVSYYCDVLGFHVIGEVQSPPVYAMVQRDGFQVHFAKQPEGQVTTNNSLRHDMTDFIIWIPEIDDFYAEIKAKQADIVQEIEMKAYGSREFIIRDCDGHFILVGD